MFTLAHMSDPHLGPLPAVNARQLASKRILGYLNWQGNRAKAFTSHYLESIVADVRAMAPDHIALCGDLVNLALPAEIINAAVWLRSLGSPQDVSLVPGNHDAYVPGAIRSARQHWLPYMLGDDAQSNTLEELDGTPSFPYLRVRGDVAIIGVSSAAATGPFMATGRIGKSQLERLAALLETCEKQGLCRVVMLHHPPVKGATPHHKRLVASRRFAQVIAKYGAELILHGHTHLDTQMQLPGPHGAVPVLCVPSASNGPGGHKPAAAYKLYHISKEENHWHCLMETRGIQDKKSGVTSLAKAPLILPNSS
ncbi:metallophosphoesterase family protein [Polycladidibacter hongkongensis]|uniref:metallophosphoesterase family protein n=1 Tax=Polycladidibacter hongkongensis TaxID=1647556 RepID=UPI00082C14D0|nr:metallophosphoesterase [Pseudovibrio hongkongensis]